ncbi:MAG: hypothetical protein AB7N80_06775 [Bdellovibrionales bacterium]
MITITLPEAHEESFDEVCRELMAVSRRLEELLPDPTLSPQERLERLGRVAPHSTLNSENHLTARAKLNKIRLRLAELVPTQQLSTLEKIEFLVKRTHQLIPEAVPRFFMKLEKLGDQRGSDIGR